MKERGKKTKEFLWRGDEYDDVSSECYYSYSPDLPCKKHPSVSFVGICPYCLNDRLLALVCSDFGEQRLSSCSCSDSSPNRITFPLKKEKINDEISKQSHKTDKVVFFRRSNSSCVEIKRKHRGIWGIGKLLRRIGSKRDGEFPERSVLGGGYGGKIDSWGSECDDLKKHGVSRSRSLCSFRGNGFYVGSEDGSSYSGARSSISAARSSSVNGGFSFFDTEARRSGFDGRRSGFSEKENRKSNFSETEQRRSCFEGRKSNFSDTEHQKGNNFRESEQRRSCFDGRRSYFSESGKRRSYFDGRKSNFGETEHRTSNFSEPEQRKSYFAGRRSNFSETGQRRTDAANNPNRRVFFTGSEEPGFIDLKFDYSSSEMNPDFSPIGSDYEKSKFQGLILDHGGGSCRIAADERGIKKSGKSFKGWRWIFRH